MDLNNFETHRANTTLNDTARCILQMGAVIFSQDLKYYETNSPRNADLFLSSHPECEDFIQLYQTFAALSYIVLSLMLFISLFCTWVKYIHTEGIMNREILASAFQVLACIAGLMECYNYDGLRWNDSCAYKTAGNLWTFFNFVTM